MWISITTHGQQKETVPVSDDVSQERTAHGRRMRLAQQRPIVVHPMLNTPSTSQCNVKYCICMPYLLGKYVTFGSCGRSDSKFLRASLSIPDLELQSTYIGTHLGDWQALHRHWDPFRAYVVDFGCKVAGHRWLVHWRRVLGPCSYAPKK